MPRQRSEVEGMAQTAALKAAARAERVRRMRQLMDSGEHITDVARRFGMKAETVRRHIKRGT